MDDKAFMWTPALTKKLFKLRFENDWLFKKKKQPWSEFYKILLENGFPQEMTINHVRKKWGYTYDSYRIAKKMKNRQWIYYKIFDKHYGKTNILDKYESWDDEWRLKLITCITATKEANVMFCDMWRTVETAMRSQELPSDCCIQDMKGLWHHIRATFVRKHRLAIKKRTKMIQWPLYDVMLQYYKKFELESLLKIESSTTYNVIKRKSSVNYLNKHSKKNVNVQEFQWSKHITETFIQIRLQNDWLFKERKWAWNDLAALMAQEHGFPKYLSGRELGKKWASIYSEYQKAKATNNQQWVYYNLFEVYIGEGSLSLNPLIGWQEEWVSNFIVARTNLESMFKQNPKNLSIAWREVEKKLRSSGLPKDHSLLELPEIWDHLVKTFRWKQKFADKGILNEQWPYYELMAKHKEMKTSLTSIEMKHKVENADHNADDGFLDDDDDIKLFDLKQRLQVKPKYEVIDANVCRACASDEACINIFEEPGDNQLDIAEKLKLIGGVEVVKSENLPTQICFTCLNDLENAYKFRKRCQDVDRQFRINMENQTIKVEIRQDESNTKQTDAEAMEHNKTDEDFDSHYDLELPVAYEMKEPSKPANTVTKRVIIKKSTKRKGKLRKIYEYWKVCEVCGKNTRNLQSHMDTHADRKMYSCDDCGKQFKFKSGLVVHKASHTGTPKKKCEVCGKIFYVMAHYRKHFVYHANERKYECETCGKRFNTLDILKVHRRMHTDERPFACKDCGKTFRTAGCVSRHRRIVHKTAVKVL